MRGCSSRVQDEKQRSVNVGFFHLYDIFPIISICNCQTRSLFIRIDPVVAAQSSLQRFHYFQYNSASSRHHQSRDRFVVQVENTLSVDLAHKLPHLISDVREADLVIIKKNKKKAPSQKYLGVY